MIKKVNIIFIFLIFIIHCSSHAQRWKRTRYELIYGVGVTNFLGDLGGADRPGTHRARDLEFTATRPSFYVGCRYKIHERVSVRINLAGGMIAGNDNWSTSSRTGRNIYVKSTIFESSVQGEFSLINERLSSRYSFSNFRDIKDLVINTYIFVGAGGVYFNPKGQYTDGKWYPLQPLGTEGQGLSGEEPMYSKIALCIPVGIGFKYGINRKYSCGMEVGVRYTSTDYMDDTSTDYYDNEAIYNARGDLAAYFADPREGEKVGPNSPYRGDPSHNDAYIFLLFKFIKKLRTARNGLPKF